MTKDGQSTTGSLLKLIWGAIPILVLIVIIMMFSHSIQAKKDKLEAVKRGMNELQGMTLAAKNIDKVVEILSAADDVAEAVKKLIKELDINSGQAKAIVQLPLGSLTKFHQDKISKQIVYLEKKIAEENTDMQSEIPEVNIVTLELSPKTMKDRINLPGVVEPWVKFNIIAEVRGEVEKKMIEKGTQINEGDIIVVLDKRDYEIALQAARASYDTALASKGRLEKLYKEKLASKSQLDDVTALVEQHKARLDSASLNLERCTVRSPISGIINELYIDKGKYVNVSDPIAEVLQMDKVKVKVGIPESDVSAVAHVEDFEVKLDALDGRTFKAEKYFLSLASDPQARLYNLELRLDNPFGEILPDMFARVEILKQEIENTLSVPLYSIITLNDSQVVYVVNDSQVHSRKVQVGIQEGWRIEITEGLKAGDQVIVVGHRSVSDGQKVNVVRTVSNMEELAN